MLALLCVLFPVQLSAPTNVASLVIHQAVSKALDRFNLAMSKQQQDEQQQASVSSPAGRRRQQQQQQAGAEQQAPEGPQDLTYEELKVGVVLTAARAPAMATSLSPHMLSHR
jgi:hypothetical protein